MPSHRPIRFGTVAGTVALLAIGYLAGRFAPFFARSENLSVVTRAAPYVSALSSPVRSGVAGDSSAEAAKAAPAPSDPRSRWAELLGRPPSAARELAMAECLRRLAATDPDGALALARQETNFRARQALVVASLQGWAGRDPAASLAWAAENLFETNRREAIEAVIEAGLELPGETTAAIRALCAKTDEATASDYGSMLIAALARRADFEGALRFAADAPVEGRGYLVGSAMYSWSQYRPDEAAGAIAAITDPATRNEALHGLILGWGSNDPASLLKYAATMPDGPVRAQAFNEALQNWVANDPVAASAWLDKHESDPVLDGGAAKLATSPFLVANQVETALSWANSVADPEQRSIALVDVVQQWAKRDPAAARAYADKLPDLQPAYREQLMRSLASSGAGGAPPPHP